MNPAKRVFSDSVDASELLTGQPEQKQQSLPQENETEESTFGQRLADKLATKVGSWTFINVQSAILAGWIGLNVMPGVPHWDESPFILLNLVFSFASAYTAPVVLMSQNRQSETDRKKAELDYKVNVKAGQNIELIHEKIDNLQSQQLKELVQVVKEQQRSIDALKVSLATVGNERVIAPTPNEKNESQISVLPTLNEKTNGHVTTIFLGNKLLKNIGQPIGDNIKVIDKHLRR